MRIIALSGGIGGAKLALGLFKVLEPGQLTVVANTGDDINLFGLHISPDVDILMYTLAGKVNPEKGWGVVNDTFACLVALNETYGQDTWFSLGDADLATHILRTKMMREGHALSAIAQHLCDRMGLKGVTLLPMTDDSVSTHVRIENGSRVHFEEYFVKRKCQDKVRGVEYVGADLASPAPGVLDSIAEADAIVICPSNPIASIGPILSIEAIRRSLRNVKCPVIAVNPLVGGKAIKGPTEEFMSGLGIEVSARGVAEYYRDVVTHMVIDVKDSEWRLELKKLGVRTLVANTVMYTLEEKMQVAQDVLSLVP